MGLLLASRIAAIGVCSGATNHWAVELETGALFFDACDDFWQRVADDGRITVGQFLQSLPASREESFLLANVGPVECAFVEWAFDDHRLKIVGDDVLGERSVAADVTLGAGMQNFGVEHADDVSQVEIAVGQIGDIMAADFAEITFVAFRHGELRVESQESRVRILTLRSARGESTNSDQQKSGNEPFYIQEWINYVKVAVEFDTYPSSRKQSANILTRHFQHLLRLCRESDLCQLLTTNYSPLSNLQS